MNTIEEKNNLMADICGSGEATVNGKYVKFTVQQMEELTDYLYENYTPNTEVQKQVEDGVMGFATEMNKFAMNKKEVWGKDDEYFITMDEMHKLLLEQRLKENKE